MTLEPSQSPAGGPTTRPYDDLLTQILAGAVDQDYVVAAQRRGDGGERSGGTPAFVVVVALFGILLGVSALKADQDRPVQAAERAQLVDQIHSRQARLDAMHNSLTTLQDDVTRRQAVLSSTLADEASLGDRLSALAVGAGTVAVTGPGVSVTVDDAPDSGSVPDGVIRDSDLQLLVNGLWEAGAEGVAIDGHRVTSLTSIRYAGRAITVDYRSLTPPYVVDAIGNPDTLPGRLLQSDGGKVWVELHTNLGIRFDIETSQSLTLPAYPNHRLIHARVMGGRP